MLRTRSKTGSSALRKSLSTRRMRNPTSASLRYILHKPYLALAVYRLFKLGGTVGDIESAPFIEAMRQFQFRVGPENFALIHVSLVPEMHGEQKTKPTQTTVHALRGLGLLPDIVSLPNSTSFLERFRQLFVQIACRLLTSAPLATATKNKISMFCHVQPQQVVGIHNVSSVYHVPLLLRAQGLIEFLQKRLNLQAINIPSSMIARGEGIAERWKELTKRSARPRCPYP
jgi:CTP synthase